MPSLERRLLAWVLGALCMGAAVLMLVSYLVTLEEMDEIFDENLKQVALAVASHHRFGGGPVPRGALPALPRVYEEEGDFDFVSLAWTRDGTLEFTSDPSVVLPFSDANGSSQVHGNGEDWHLYTIVRNDGVLQVAQRASSRRMLAAEAASKLFPPFLVLIALIGLLLVVALRRGLVPLDRAAQDVAARSAASLEPIDDIGAPQEIRPMIRSINGLMQRLAHAFGAQRRFVADAAHELRSPVTALRLQLQVLERAGDDAARTHALSELKAGISRSQRLIEQLLELSRAEPDAPSRHEALDLGDVVREVVAHRSTEADRKDIDLGAEVIAAARVVGDRDQLRVLLDNLVGNALRYTPRGGRVDVRSSQVDGRSTLQVIDNGPGIAPQERTRAFDRFYRGEGLQGDERMSGSGLGLAIVQAIAHRHRATVSLHTAPSGSGLEARVVFSA